MSITIRKAVLEDYPHANEMMQQIQELHVAWRPDIYRHSESMFPIEYFTHLLEGGSLYIAELDGEPSGLLELVHRHIEYPPMVTRNVLYIETMVVKDGYRGKGIGHAFFAMLKEMKQSLGYDGIELQVNAKNAAAIKMYTNYGFTPKSINMELPCS